MSVSSHYSHVCPKCARKVAANNTKICISKKLENDPDYYNAIVAKRKKTNKELHGDPNWNNEMKNKLTCMEKYGVDNVRKTQQCKNAIKQTKLEKYGDENFNNIEKFKATCLANHGVEWPMQSAFIRKKSASKYTYDNYEFDSKQELCFYIWLKDHNVHFNVNTSIKFQYMHNGKMHWYIPDFIVNGHPVEIKGDHFFKEDGTM